MRFRIQRRRPGHTTTVTISGEQFTLVANQHADGTLGEVFIRCGKHGTSGAGLLDGYATALSVGLAYRVPLADLLRSGLDLHFAPYGHTDDPEIPRVRSVADYLARRLAIDWLPYPERAALGIYTLTERVALARDWMRTADPSVVSSAAPSRVSSAASSTVPSAERLPTTDRHPVPCREFA
jgi:hypothetical protein